MYVRVQEKNCSKERSPIMQIVAPIMEEILGRPFSRFLLVVRKGFPLEAAPVM